MAKNLLIMVLLLLPVVACGGQAGIPTLAPTIDLGSATEPEGSSPRVTPQPGLPPTYTPAPSPEPAVTIPQPAPEAAPGEVTPEPAEDDRQVYVVQRGDTLAEIANRFGVTLEALALENNIENIDRIEVGQRLVIPRQ